jgi:hypothetical protein
MEPLTEGMLRARQLARRHAAFIVDRNIDSSFANVRCRISPVKTGVDEDSSERL